MGRITKERIKQLDEIGEDVIFEEIISGRPVRQMILEWGLGWRTWYKWLESQEGRKARYDEALNLAGHAYAQRAVETAQMATPETVNVARLQVDTDKWIASKLNTVYDTRQKETTVTLRVEDLHSQAAALISQEAERAVIDAVYEDVTDNGDDEDDSVEGYA